jgi:hypothetical protein
MFYACAHVLLEQAQDKKGRTLYLWNGKTFTSSEANYTSVALIDHAPNMSYLHLISSRIVDTNADNIDVLSDLSSAKNMMLAYAQMTGIDMTILDAEQLAHAATNTLDMVHKTVTSVIDNSFSFLVWLHKFVVFVLICLLVCTPIFVAIRCRTYFVKRELRQNINKILVSANQPQTLEQELAMQAVASE